MNTKFFERDVRVDVRHSLTLSARVWLIEMLRKDCMSARSAVNVWIVVWIVGVSFGSGGCPHFGVTTGIIDCRRVMVFTVMESQ